MKKKLMLFALVLILLCTTVFAATVSQTNTADAMNYLGLFLGTNKGYELDNGLTRAQGITLLVRMIGEEDEANHNTSSYIIPFNDVDSWAVGYVGYAYTNGITIGISKTAFGSNHPMTDYMFLTLTLRALGYSDIGANPAYTWDNPYNLAFELGLVESSAPDANFTRADAVSVFWNALDVVLNGSNQTLADRLIEQEVFTADELEKACEIQKTGCKTEDNITEVTPTVKPDPNPQTKPDANEDPKPETNTPQPNPGGGTVGGGGPFETPEEELT